MTQGIFAVNKESGLSSQAVLNRCKRQLNVKKVGHSGTLDPLASGVLVIATGACTRLLNFLVGAKKRYFATFRLGVVTDTYDITGKVISKTHAGHLNLDDLIAASAVLRGEILQTPPRYSAVHINGERAYALARRGESFEVPPRLANVYELKIDTYKDDCFTMYCEVSSGTYVRSLIYDLGQVLGVGATMTALVRLGVGDIDTDLAVEIENLSEASMLDPKTVFPGDLHLGVECETTLGAIANGRSVVSGDIVKKDDVADKRVFLYEPDSMTFDRLVAVANVEDGSMVPKVVLPRRVGPTAT